MCISPLENMFGDFLFYSRIIGFRVQFFYWYILHYVTYIYILVVIDFGKDKFYWLISPVKHMQTHRIFSPGI